VGVAHKEINLSLPSGIIHSHLIALVRHKQARVFKVIQTATNDFLQNYKNILF